MDFSDERILRSYPSISLADIEKALVFYARNREDIEQDILENEAVY